MGSHIMLKISTKFFKSILTFYLIKQLSKNILLRLIIDNLHPLFFISFLYRRNNDNILCQVMKCWIAVHRPFVKIMEFDLEIPKYHYMTLYFDILTAISLSLRKVGFYKMLWKLNSHLLQWFAKYLKPAPITEYWLRLWSRLLLQLWTDTPHRRFHHCNILRLRDSVFNMTSPAGYYLINSTKH